MNRIKDLTQRNGLCLFYCVGFHWRPAFRVCGGLHLARSSGKCRLWGPIPAGHCGSTALHRPPSGGDCTQGGCPVCLPWCHGKGKPDTGQETILRGRRMFKNLLIWPKWNWFKEYLHFLAFILELGQKSLVKDQFLILEINPQHYGYMLCDWSTRMTQPNKN